MIRRKWLSRLRTTNKRRAQGMVDGRLMLNATAAVLAMTGVIGGMLAVAKSDTTNLHGEPNAAWLAGGDLGRVLLGAIGGTRPSYGVPVGAKGSDYDVVAAGDRVFVLDRATGQIVTLDARSGADAGLKLTAPIPLDDRSTMVGAGDSVYLVDIEQSTLVKVDAAGVTTEPVEVDGGFTDWVGADDGRLWMFDRDEGDTVTFDGESVNRASLSEADADVVLTAVGDDPVVLDRTAGKVRWPRRSESIEISGAATAVIQSRGRAAECVTIVNDGEVRCLDARGAVRSMPLAIDHPEAAQLFATSDNLVVAWRDSDRLVTGSWHTNSSAVAKRLDPSGRSMIGHEAIGHLLVDDPGGGYAFSVDHGTIVDLEKFSKDTIIITADGQVDTGGVVASDDEAGLSAEIGGKAEELQVADNNNREDPPRAIDDIAVTRVGRQIEINVLANDSDPENQPLAIVDHTDPGAGDGEVEVIGGSFIQFTPGDSPGTVTFDYTIADPGQLKDVARVTIKVLSDTENTFPRAEDDEYETPEGISIEMPVLANDVDDEGDELYFDEGLAKPAHGTVAPLDRDLIYTPDPGFTGTDSFVYFVVDGHGGRDQATVRVTVTTSTGKNRPPVAVDDSYSLVAGKSRVAPLLANDSDPDGELPSIRSVSEDSGLQLAVLSDGRVEIKAPKGTSGPKVFTYEIVDAAGAKDTATVTVRVEPVTENRAPIGRDDSLVTSGQPVRINPLLNDTDPDSDPLSLTRFTQPDSGGQVTLVGESQLRFDPDANLESNATVSFTYTISDPSGETDTATIRVVINKPTGAPPIALPESVDIYPGETARLNVLANDSHPDGLDFSLDGSPSTSANGTLVVGPNSIIEFTPLSPVPDSYPFRYCIKDVNGQTACTVDTVNVIAKPIENTAPVAENDSERTDRDQSVVIDVLANDHDIDNDKLTIGAVGDPSPSGRTDPVGNKIRYTPVAGFTGLASFTYSVSDGINPAQTATVVVQVVAPAQAPPIAKNDLVNLTVGDIVQLNPTSNDDDPDGTVLTLDNFESVLGVTITRAAAGSNTLKITSVTPDTYTISYTVSDSDGLTDTGQITIVVAPPPNQPPIALGDSPSSMLPKGSKTIDVLSNDYDQDGGPVTITSVSNPSPSGSGSVDFTTSSVTFTPDSGFSGEVTFTYTISDDEGGQDTATVTITVNPCPPQLTLPDLTTTTRYQRHISTKILGGDPAPGTLAVQDPPDAGQSGTTSVTDPSIGKVRYDPPNGFNGTVTYSYTVTNECEQTATGHITVTVNNQPTATDDDGVTQRNQSIDIDVLANDDPGDSGDVLKLDSFGSVVGGTVSITSGGKARFKPAAAATSGSFTYTALDEGGQSATANVIVTIGNDPPNAHSDHTGTIQPGDTVTELVTANDTDANGDELTVVDSPLPTVSPAGAGTVSVNGGNITFTAASGAGGPVEITYKATDGLATDTSRWTLYVNQAPTASNTSNSTREQVKVNTNVVFGSTGDPDGDAITLITGGVDAPSITSGNGSITNLSNGGDIEVTPAGGFTGTITVSYTIWDGFLKKSATLTISVSANNAPNVNDESAMVIFTDAVSVDVLSNDNDPDNDPLSLSNVTPSGDLSIDSVVGGTITVHSTTGALGTFGVTYTVSDGFTTVNGTLWITVT